MTVPSTVQRVDALGNGVTTTFSFAPFTITQASDLSVILRSSAGVETVLSQGTLNTNYTLNLSSFPGTGSITYPASGSTGGTVLPTGATLVMRRVVPLVQNSVYRNQTAFYGTSVEQSLDYLMMCIQQLFEATEHAIQTAATDPDLIVTLPTTTQRALQMLGFDASGNPIAAQPSSALVSTAMQPVTAAASIAAAQTLLMGFNPLAAATTIYVTKAGNDTTGTGLIGAPFLTIQKAVDVATTSRMIQNTLLTIQVGAGTYTESVSLKNFIGSYQRQGIADSTGIILRGDPTTPANVIISQNLAGVFCLSAAGLQTNWEIDGFQLTNPSGGLILADWGTTLSLGNMNYSTAGSNMIQAQYHSRIELMRGCVHKLVGNTPGAFASANAMSIVLAQGHSGAIVTTINIAGGLTIGAGASATNLSFIDLTDATFTGSSITGTAWGATNSLYSQFNDNIFPATSKGSQQGVRIPATGTINYYVTTTGNDTSGRGTVAAPFATIQAAVNYALTQMDTVGLDININVGTGSFFASVLVQYNPIGGGTISIIGNGTASTLISTGGDAITTTLGARLNVRNLSVASGGNCLRATLGGQITVNGAVTFGTCGGSLCTADTNSVITIGAAWAISANAPFALVASRNSVVITSGTVCTVAGGLTFTQFAAAFDGGVILTTGGTYSTNVATGTRMNVTTNGVINTSGAGAAYFPGNVNGAASTGGQYV